MIDNHTVGLLLNLPTIDVTKVTFTPTEITISCESKLVCGICPNCLKNTEKSHQRSTRTVRDMAIAGRTVYLDLTTRQFHCADCNRYFYERFNFVEPSKTLTTRYEKHVYECCRDSTIERVVVQENVVWETVQEVFTRYAKKETAFLSNYQPKRIGLDEFAIKKGHKDFAVTIIDLDKCYALDVLDFRTKDELIAYFRAKGDEYCSKIEVFSCDLWDGFITTAQMVFPNADIVPDRFHIFKLLHEVVNKERKKLRKQYPEDDELKSIKWLLFKSWDKLSYEQRRLLLRAFRKSENLRKLYWLKQELRNIFETECTKEIAEKHLLAWIEEAKILKHNVLNTFIKTVTKHFKNILNFFTHRVSNGIVEGINNVIKAIKRQGFGFRNFENFKLKIQLKFI